MKKLIALLLVFMMVFSLCACAAEDDSKSSKKPSTSETEPTEENWAGKKPTGTEPTEGTNPTTEPTEDGNVTEPTEPSSPVASSGPTMSVEAWVDENGEEFLQGLEQGFEVSGLTCTSSIEAVGNGMVIYIFINELDNVDNTSKQQMQATYDQNIATYEYVLAMMRQEVPDLEYMKYYVCEGDGDILATIRAEN